MEIERVRVLIKGIGVDLVELKRMRQIIEERPAFIQRVLTENEYALFLEHGSKRQVEFLAGRFACKEAFSKAYGTGIGKSVTLQNVEILTDNSGRPIVTQSPFDGQVHVSISHTDDMAIGQVLLEELN